MAVIILFQQKMEAGEPIFFLQMMPVLITLLHSGVTIREIKGEPQLLRF